MFMFTKIWFWWSKVKVIHKKLNWTQTLLALVVSMHLAPQNLQFQVLTIEMMQVKLTIKVYQPNKGTPSFKIVLLISVPAFPCIFTLLGGLLPELSARINPIWSLIRFITAFCSSLNVTSGAMQAVWATCRISVFFWDINVRNSATDPYGVYFSADKFQSWFVSISLPPYSIFCAFAFGSIAEANINCSAVKFSEMSGSSSLYSSSACLASDKRWCIVLPSGRLTLQGTWPTLSLEQTFSQVSFSPFKAASSRQGICYKACCLKKSPLLPSPCLYDSFVITRTTAFLVLFLPPGR